MDVVWRMDEWTWFGEWMDQCGFEIDVVWRMNSCGSENTRMDGCGLEKGWVDGCFLKNGWMDGWMDG